VIAGQVLADVAIVGAGFAGMSAAIFAGARGLSTVQVGNAGALLFSSGPLDLMGVHPVEEGRTWSDPFAAAAAVARDIPGHPYARVDAQSIRAAFVEIVAALGEAGLDYGPLGDANRELVTGAGTVKTTYCVPRSMLANVEALAGRVPCLLVDFHGLREYSAAGIVAALSERWPRLRALRVEFRAGVAAGETHAAHLARALELAASRAALAEQIRPHLADARAVGLPAVLGLRRTDAIAADLAGQLGVPVFEVPTIPTSVPGLRLKDAFERAVARRGVRRIVQRRAIAVVLEADHFALHLEDAPPGSAPLRARAVVLATGRFMGHGLVADRSRIRETLLDLPVVQPASRSAWHQADFFDPRGHAVNRAGVSVDETFRPCDAAGQRVHPRLFAIGTLLAHHDWARTKCGAGVAIVSARAAILAAARELGTPSTAQPAPGGAPAPGAA